MNKQWNTKARRILMLGPHLTTKGGITTVEEVYFKAWDHSQFLMKHVPTYIDHHPKWIKFLFTTKALLEYLYVLIFWNPALVHMHFSWRASFYRKSVFLFLAKLFRKKVILHCHSSSFDHFYNTSSTSIQGFIRFTLNRADKVIVLSEKWRQYFEKMNLNVPIEILHNAIESPKRNGSFCKNKRVILSLGQLSKRKGTYDILKAVPRVLQAYPDAEFWLGGDGDIEEIKELLKSKPWKKQVRLLGWAQGKKKEEAFHQASIFLLPSYAEGLPMSILEALSYGLPIVSTPIGGIPEAVIDGKSGFLIQPGGIDAMIEKLVLLLGDNKLRQEMGKYGHNLVIEKFDIDSILQKLFNHYNSLVKIDKAKKIVTKK